MSPSRPSPVALAWAFVRAALRAFTGPFVALVCGVLFARWIAHGVRVSPGWAREHVIAVRLAQTFAWLAGTTLVMRMGRFFLYERLLLRLAKLKAPRLVDQAGATFAYLVGGGIVLTYVWQFSLSSLLATSGVIGLVLGLALKNVLSDFLSGIALNLEVPFSLHEFVLLRLRGYPNPIVGLVREVSWRSTTVVTPEKKTITLPNTLVAEAVIENGSRPVEDTEFELEIVLDWAVRGELLEQLLRAAALETFKSGATVGSEPPKVRIRRLDPDGVAYKITYLVDPTKVSKARARHALLRNVHKHLRCAGLRPVNERGPSPQRPFEHDRADDRLVIFDEVSIFATISREERATLASIATVRRCRESSVVVRQGAADASMYIVAAGLLEVSVAGAPDATATPLATLGPGDFFGEMSALTGEARSATVRALVPSVLYELSRDNVRPLLELRPQLVAALSEVVAERARARAPLEGTSAGTREPGDARLSRTIAEAIHEFLRA